MLYFHISVSAGNADLGTSGCNYPNRNETPECHKFHRYDAGPYVPPPNLCDSSNRYYEMDPNLFLLSLSTHILVPRDEATLFSPSHHLVKEIQCEKVTYIDIISLMEEILHHLACIKNCKKMGFVPSIVFTSPPSFNLFPQSIHRSFAGKFNDFRRIIGTPISQKGHWYKEIKHIQGPETASVPGSECLWFSSILLWLQLTLPQKTQYASNP